MKKKLIAALLSGTLILAPCISVLADEKDDKIAELEGQIVELQKTIDELQSKLEKASAPQSTSQRSIQNWRILYFRRLVENYN